MKTIVAVGGEPGTGKTTLVKRLIGELDTIPSYWQEQEAAKLLPITYSLLYDLCILGTYPPNEVFGGTDKLSMAVQPVAEKFVKETKSNVLFEGDRLFNQSFLEFLVGLADQNEINLKIFFLTANSTLLQERYQERGSNQDKTWLKGRQSKISNLFSSFVLMPYSTGLMNETLVDREKNMKIIIEAMNFTIKNQ